MSSKSPTESMVLSFSAISAIPDEGFASSGPDSIDGGNVTWKTLFSSEKTPTNTFTTGIAKCAKKGDHLKCHRHTHPEIYHVTQGKGIMTIDGKASEVEKGSVVFVPGDAEHGITNVGEEELMWLYVFATDAFSDIVYRFSASESSPAVKAKL